MSRRPILQYKEERLGEALAAIRDGMKIRAASRKYGVPRGTIQDRLHSRVSEGPRKMGPDSILSKEEEAILTTWRINLAKCGFPLKPIDLINSVQKIVTDDNRPNPFVNNRPGKKWYSSFLRRNPILSERTPENISKGRAVVSAQSIRKWFDTLLEYLVTKGAADILQNPDRIFSGDETNFFICAKTGKVIAPRGYKNVYTIAEGNNRDTITVLLFISASGATLPPCVVFPYIQPPKAVVNSVPSGWFLGNSKSGWMKSNIFYDYITKGLDKWVNDKQIQKPVLVFVDGHKSHLTLCLSKYCDRNGIILYSLPPNATHLMQSADVSVFKPLKSEWKTTLRQWGTQPENINKVLKKANFCQLLSKVLQKENLPSTIRNGFRRCGLYPFDPDGVDYTKCVLNNNENLQSTEESQHEMFTKSQLTQAIKVIEYLREDILAAGVDTQTVIDVIEEAKTRTPESSQRSSMNGNENAHCLAQDINSTMVSPEIVNDSSVVIPVKGDAKLEQYFIQSDFDTSQTTVSTFKIAENSELIPDLTFTDVSENEIVSIQKDDSDMDDENTPIIFLKEEPIENPENIEEKVSFNKIKDNEASSAILIQSGKISPSLKNILKVDRVGAISSDVWRRIEQEKVDEKNNKKASILMRKMQRAQIKEKKEEETRKRKMEKESTVILKRKKIATKPRKNLRSTQIKCSECNEEMVSETEENDLKNIGCDVCPSWYHLKCTKFIGRAFEEVVDLNFVCQKCPLNE